MATEDFSTGRDIFNGIMQTARQAQSLTDPFALDAKMAIMQEYRSILQHAQFFFAKYHTPGIITTVARERVIVSSIAGAVVTLAASLSTSMAGRKFYMDSTHTYYRILSHDANTAVLVLDAPYAETQAAGVGTIYLDEYPLLTNVIMPWTPMRIRGQWERDLHFRGEPEFRARYGWSTTAAISIPEAFTWIRANQNQQIVVQIAPWPDKSINIEYDYSANPAALTFDGVVATDTPMIPQPYRWVLYQRALSQVFASKDDNLSERAWKRADVGLAEMVERYTVSPTENKLFSRPRYSLGC